MRPIYSYALPFGGCLLAPLLAVAQTIPAPAATTSQDPPSAALTNQPVTARTLAGIDVVQGTAGTGVASPPSATALKSLVPLAQTAQSVTVLSRALLDDQQARSVNDALSNVAGVVSNTFGRSTRDDFIIRGQRASESEYLDGMLVGANNTTSAIAQELYGAQSLEVLKGPASILFGRVQPGGLVNIVSKRPGATPFATVATTMGSHDLYQVAGDANAPLSADGRDALRLTALASNSNDTPQQVYDKKRYLAPALSLGLGESTDLVILSSYANRQYLRQQGLPPVGTVLPDRHGTIPFDRFTGDPNQAPYDTTEERLGYLLTHRFNDDWTLHHDLRFQHASLDGDFVSNGALAADQRTLARSDSRQRYIDTTITTNNYLEGKFDTGELTHHLTVGADYLQISEQLVARNCSLGKLDVFSPVYGVPVTCPAASSSDNTSRLRDAGAYLRDQLQIDERWWLSAGLRYDDTTNRTRNNKTGLTGNTSADATTGHLGLLYDLTDRLHPYVSYASSFVPNSGTDVSGRSFSPDRGRQAEAGLKIALPKDSGSLTLAAYQLKRNDVLSPDADHPGFSVAIGQQRSRGLEAEWAADFHNGLSLFAGYAYTLTAVTRDNALINGFSDVGRPLDNVPRHNLSLWTSYQFKGALSGWHAGVGVQAQSFKRGFDFSYTVPGYAVLNAAIGYAAAHWHTAINIDNALDRRYYAAGINQNAVGIGNARELLWTIGVDF